MVFKRILLMLKYLMRELRMSDTMNLGEMFPEGGKAQRIYCSACNKAMLLVFRDFKEVVSGIDFSISGLPNLHCPTCDNYSLPDRSRICVVKLHEEGMKSGASTCRVNRNKTDENFKFAKVPFIYDSDDYYYIPGLLRPQDVGFLTPVFFKPSVLLKFQNHPNYRVRFASKTYGTIQLAEDEDIAFGVNSTNKVIMWLGDLANLPEDEQYYLRSENIASDHDIGSEFYDGQIEAVFTDYTPEEILLQARSGFFNFFFDTFGEDLSHLTTETLEAVSHLNPPVLHTLKEQKDIVDLLNKINIEGISSAALTTCLRSIGADPEKLGTLKKLELLLDTKFPDKGVSKKVSALFVLYDLRVTLLHAVSDATKAKTMNKICDRLEIPRESAFDVIYPKLIEELTICFSELASLS